MSDSKTANAAAKAVARSEKKDPSKRTDLEVIADVRRLLGSGLAVSPDDQRFLLTKYDDVHALMVLNTNNLRTEMELNAAQSTTISELQAKLEEFRAVYEAENSSQVLKVFRTPPAGAPDSTESGSVESVPEPVADEGQPEYRDVRTQAEIDDDLPF